MHETVFYINFATKPSVSKVFSAVLAKVFISFNNDVNFEFSFLLSVSSEDMLEQENQMRAENLSGKVARLKSVGF